MAAEFVGLSVVVRLNSPTGTLLQGLVVDVQDQRLHLHNVLFPQNGRMLHEYVIHGSEIADIEVAPNDRTVQRAEIAPALSARQHHNAPDQSQFTDPAILTYQRPSASHIGPPANTYEAHPPPTLNERINALSVQNNGQIDSELEYQAVELGEPSVGKQQASLGATSSVKGGKKSSPNKKGRGAPAGSAIVVQESSSPEAARKKLHKVVKPNGWRQTPILQESNELGEERAEAIHGSGGKRRTNKKRAQQQSARKTPLQNGWATEDATDVQELGDFDFEGNLSMFDKRAVFDQLRSEDHTTFEDRLVGHNQNQHGQIGTFGGKNYHPLENVLERPRLPSKDLDILSVESDDGDAAQGESATSSRAMNRTFSRNSARQQLPPRKDSSTIVGEPVNRSSRGQLSRAKYASSQPPTSPRGQRTVSPGSAMLLSTAPPNRKRAAFRYAETNRICPTIQPAFLEEVETVAHDDFGITADISAENAARGIADVALSAVSPNSRRVGQSGNPQPVVVVLIGPETSAGARAIAAARHLRERRITVVLSLAWPASNNGVLQSQLARFEGDALNWKETAAFLKTLDAPPELIIDGLLGPSESLANLSLEQDQTIMSMIGWANKSRASVLSVDIPAGVDAETGEVKMKEGEPAEVRAKFIVCCGAPCVGLVRALELKEQDDEDWRVFVCDVGINAAWRMALRRSKEKRNHKGINFSHGWVLALKFDPGLEA